MTKFTKENFEIHSAGGECTATYLHDGKRLFVARFKHGSPSAVVRGHVKHLLQHVTVEEWMDLEAMPEHDPSGEKKWVDLRLAKDARKKELFQGRGYIQYNILKMMKQYGFTAESQLMTWNSACIDARRDGKPAPLASQFR